MSIEATIAVDGSSSPQILEVRAAVSSGPDSGKSAAAAEILTVGTAESNDLVLTDDTVSRFHLDLLRAGDRITVRDHSTNGSHVGEIRIDQASVRPGTVIRIGRTSLTVGDGNQVTRELFPGERLGGILGRSDAMRQVMAQVRRVAHSDTSVLLLGETGTGKEVIARAIHEESRRSKGPFEIVDCGAMQPTLVGSELFGHEKGAFTGADSPHVGAFERANGGTVFLDEIGELPPALQAALLGALERKAIRRLGGKTQIRFDARVVSATHRDLRSEVNDGTFRQDLFYRLAVVILRLPPLRERREDIPMLAEHFVRAHGETAPLELLFPPRVMDTLIRHRWPGNVRELRNAVEAALVMGEARGLDDEPQPGRTERKVAATAGSHVIALDGWLGRPLPEARSGLTEAFEDVYLRDLLERTEGNVTEAAEVAGVDRSYLSRMIRKRGIKLKRIAD
ncbi:MAG: sigma 54-dependent Fis family transcriptional regulator [Deltaproteobacteria bacterium]|nr:sigma 54-dependent Fis family transcriptional regulator [Deltaproteobacteria bacterium]